MAHVKDSDCLVNPDTLTCVTCGVLHGDPCEECGGYAFHVRGCPEMRRMAPGDRLAGLVQPGSGIVTIQG